MGAHLNPTDPDSRGGRVRAARLRLGLNLPQAAERIGIRMAFLSNVEHGRKKVTLDWLRDAADALGVPRSELDPDLADVAPRPIAGPKLSPLPGHASFLQEPAPRPKRKRKSK